MKNIIITLIVGLIAGAIGGALVGGGSSDQSVGGPFRLPNSNPQTNSENRDVDFIFRGDTDDELLYGDAGNNRVGVSTSSPDHVFHVDDDAGFGFHDTLGIADVFVDNSADALAVGTTSPDQIFHVTAGASATTTIQLGAGGSASSQACINLVDNTGTVKSAYIVGTSWVIEANACN